MSSTQDRPTAVSPAARAPQRDDSGLRQLLERDEIWGKRYTGWTVIGGGAQGLIVETRLVGVGTPVVCKVLKSLDPEDRERFMGEARASQTLTHPCVVRTNGVYAHSATVWIEMEFVEGIDLGKLFADWLGHGERWELSRTLQVALNVAEALEQAHMGEAAIIHRDIKPANILLPRRTPPFAKLADFGVARVVGAPSMTQTGQVTGTPLWMAPEVLQGKRATIASDIYSFGLVLYALVTGGAHAYDLRAESTAPEVVRAHTRLSPIALRSRGVELPPALAELVLRSLDKNPKNRPTAPALVLGLRTQLTELTSPKPVEAARAAPVAAGRARVPVWAWAAGGVCGVLVVGAVVMGSVAKPALPPVSAPASLSVPVAVASSAPVAVVSQGLVVEAGDEGSGTVRVSNQSLETIEGVVLSIGDSRFTVGRLGPDEEMLVNVGALKGAGHARGEVRGMVVEAVLR